MFSTIAIIERKLIRAARNKSDQNSSFAAFVALHQVPEVGLCSNVILIFAFFKILLRDGENPLNCSAASSALVASKLTSQAIQEIGAHAKIIAARKADKFETQLVSLRTGLVMLEEHVSTNCSQVLKCQSVM